MTIIHVTEATGGLPNSGRLSGTDGDLVGIMDVALPLNNFAIQFTSGTDRVYRPATGNRFVLTVRDAAAISGAANFATVRGAESASSATAYTDTFSLATQLTDANANWIKSSIVNTTARNFDIYVSPTWVIFLVNYSSTTNVWDAQFWGDIPAALTGDAYNTITCTRINQTAGTAALTSASTASGTVSTRIWWTRSYDGTVKSSAGGVQMMSNATVIGTIASYPVAKAGPTTGIEMQKISLADSGAITANVSTTKGLPVRGYLPNIWMPLHGGPGTINSRDTFTDTAYNGSATFKCFLISSAAWLIVEETDTWSPPAA